MQLNTEEPRPNARDHSGTKAPVAEDTTQLCDVLRKLAAGVVGLDQDAAGNCAITAAQGRILQALWNHGAPTAMTVWQLSNALGIAPSTVTRMIDRLWESEWVSRARSATDRRQVWVSLTANGEAVAAQHAAFTQHVYRAVLAEIPVASRSGILESLTALATAMQSSAASASHG